MDREELMEYARESVKVIQNSKSTTSDHDPVPTDVLEKGLTELAPVIANITKSMIFLWLFS